ncbi:hypothetical protein GCM10010387_64950 [Streptomyces inusitatus]|uniref:Uncharacterized protein n=2 Tax=Streptomyces inusitatus TaxID=68221 RepID=A0A918V494_9ACTN|nr:hypothetical protein GCM10010387_64950 [Streptomyces inusitatus]
MPRERGGGHHPDMTNFPPHPPPPAEELVLLDRELVRLDAHRDRLLARRAWLVSVLRQPAAGGPALGRALSAETIRPAETSSPSARNVLLVLGGLLLTIAAVAFTLVGWGRMGIGGRSAVLAAVTAAALAGPLALLRRGLAATAESVAALGLALLVLDAYALHRVALPDVGALAYAAWASAALAAVWAGYGRVAKRLRAPLPAAVAAAQLPLVLWSATAGPAPSPGWALLGTALFDVVVLIRATSPGVRALAAAGGSVTGALALVHGVFPSLMAGSPAEAAGPAALLAASAAVALFAAWRLPSAAMAVSAVGGLALLAGVGAVVRTAAPGGWAVPAYLLGAVALLCAVVTPGVRARTPRGLSHGLAAASATVHALALLAAVPPLLLVLAGPVAVLPDAWAGPGPDAPAGPAGGLPAGVLPAAAVSLLILAAAVAAATRSPLPYAVGPKWRAAAPGTAGGLGWAALFLAPGAVGAGFAATAAFQTALTVAALTVAARAAGRPAAWAALGCALAGGTSVAVLSSAARPATFAVLGALLAATALAAARPGAGRAVRGVLGCAATALATALLLAVAAAAGLAPQQTAPLLLAVPAGAALLAARLGGGHPVALPTECAGAGAGLLAVALAQGDAATLALVLALGGVIAAGTALRADRRRAAAPVAVVLWVLAAWARLYASDVVTPEAYTLPVTLPALAVGALRRRGDPSASSWTAYGPGLAVTLAPSLVAAWGDAHWVRPLLLGLAALAVTLAGARWRLRAPLLIGGVVLALDALHELAPYVVQAVGALPRWAPPALAGLLLLAVGATYEQRLRNARRLRERLGRMR